MDKVRHSSKFWVIAMFCLFLLGASIKILVYSPYVTWDSFHYLQLSILPVYGDTHSLIFGYVLKLFAKIASLVSYPRGFIELLYVFHFICLVSILLIPLFGLSSLKTVKAKSIKVGVSVLTVLFVILVLPALLVFMSAIWTEMIYFLILMVFVYLVDLQEYFSSRILTISMVLLLPFAYHVRYQFLIVPIALVLANVLFFLKHKGKDFRLTAVAFVGLALIFLVNLGLKSIIPSLDGTASMTRNNLATSAHCALRCDAEIFKIICDTPERTAEIEKMSCSDLALGFKSLGPMRSNYSSVLDVFRSIGFFKSCRFLFSAPFLYLKDIHKNWGLEIGRFRFLDDDAASFYKEATKFYTPFIQNPDAIAKPLFMIFVDFLTYAHFKLKLFNWLSLLIVFTNLAILIKGKRQSSLFLALISLGTWLVFSYFNPHVPFRFLIQILLPGMLAIYLELGASQKIAEALRSQKVAARTD